MDKEGRKTAVRSDGVDKEGRKIVVCDNGTGVDDQKK
jgi:hypothetical protein